MAGSRFDFAPNRMGDSCANCGVEHLTSNRGYGVNLLKSKIVMPKKESPVMNSLRVAKARQFGKSKTEVGF